jgi:hypothetical protein
MDGRMATKITTTTTAPDGAKQQIFKYGFYVVGETAPWL